MTPEWVYIEDNQHKSKSKKKSNMFVDILS